MPKLKKTSITAKKGINFLKGIVEDNGSIFHKIEQENDFGIDCIIEFFKDEEPVNVSIAFQIKSGSSYINNDNLTATIPVDDHFEYWTKYSLPVYGLVYDMDKRDGYWVNIKEYLKKNPTQKNIVFNINRSNTLTESDYDYLFFPLMTGKTPKLSLTDSVSFFQSKYLEEHYIGMSSLFKNYINKKETWDNFIGFIRNKPSEYISEQLIYYVAHIPWHGDIFYVGENIHPTISYYAKSLISEFNEAITVKLLSLINEDVGIIRGSLGESVEAIISCINNKQEVLKSIISETKYTEMIRSLASVILIYYDKNEIVFLRKYKDLDVTNLIIEFVDKFGEFELYQ
jgi:hypothetical protein